MAETEVADLEAALADREAEVAELGRRAEEALDEARGELVDERESLAVEIRASDAAFESSGCSEWTRS